jgi:hypothetical protein
MKDWPVFPTYHGPPLPKALSPLKPRHYLEMLKWIYFQPSRLKHYLHRADPVLYRAQGLGSLGQSLRLPTYRGLYVTSAIAVILLSGGFAWIASALLGTPVDLRGVALGVAGSLIFGVAFVIAGSMAFGVASGPVFGVPFGVLFGASFAVAFVVASRVAFGLTGNVAFDLAGGVAFAMAFGVALVMAVGVMSGMASGVVLAVLLVVAVGVAFGVAWVVVGGEAVVVAFVVTLVVTGIAGFSRLLLYPVEWLQARLQTRSRCDPARSSARHPVGRVDPLAPTRYQSLDANLPGR